MKTLSNLFLVAAITMLFACGGATHGHDHDHEHGSTGDSTATEVHGQGKEYTSVYVCPMHCTGSGGDQAGNCPVCGMDYVKLEEHMRDGHTH